MYNHNTLYLPLHFEALIFANVFSPSLSTISQKRTAACTCLYNHKTTIFSPIKLLHFVVLIFVNVFSLSTIKVKKLIQQLEMCDYINRDRLTVCLKNRIHTADSDSSPILSSQEEKNF